jgi:hypothetical protein
MNRSVVAFCIAAAFASAPSASARQAAPIPAHPIFSGVWSPVNAMQADRLFAAFISPVPGGAKLSIDQRPGRITVGIDLPDDDLDRFAGNNMGFFARVVYPISRYPLGGNGAGPNRSVDAAWNGEALVIPLFSAWDLGENGATKMVTFSLQDSHLAMKLEWGKASAFTQLFDRAK